MKDDKIYMNHIIQCIEDIERCTNGDKPRFFSDDMVRNACLRQLQVMAESTQHLSDEVKLSITGTNWKQIAGFRNILVHDYLGSLNHELVWGVIDKRIPELKKAIKNFVREMR